MPRRDVGGRRDRRHLPSGGAPPLRIDGRIAPAPGIARTAQDTRALVTELLGHGELSRRWRRVGQAGLRSHLARRGPLRGNAFMQKGPWPWP